MGDKELGKEAKKMLIRFSATSRLCETGLSVFFNFYRCAVHF
jgi:hypothetical protein